MRRVRLVLTVVAAGILSGGTLATAQPAAPTWTTEGAFGFSAMGSLSDPVDTVGKTRKRTYKDAHGRNMIRAKIWIESGDSGGPAYARSAQGWGPVRALGLVSSYDSLQRDISILTPVETIEKNLGGSVVTSGMSICRD